MAPRLKRVVYGIGQPGGARGEAGMDARVPVHRRAGIVAAIGIGAGEEVFRRQPAPGLDAEAPAHRPDFVWAGLSDKLGLLLFPILVGLVIPYLLIGVMGGGITTLTL